ncbi:GAF domain-containing protein [Dokdonia sp. Hel_I_53]|uniref:GAF domain-containing protein n=1 Tax=Dokdonia sp. Hel_I_53 TaxID=1566287 RepID=UPI00119AE33C|nr:GAF domain-containing protein [Dokdonia sp. Hel_I_53]TVZ52166.1 GAF domain-containing protein [Dokdonia sp. Hel_I_53]
MTFDDLKIQVTNILNQNGVTPDKMMTEICEALRTNVSYYDWVGFYMANHDSKTLHLGPFAGTPTDHTVIPFGKGICGQVAESNSNFVVPDVKGQDNYIACSIAVKSEIVIPIFKDGKNIGQIDIDSNKVDPFTKEDEDFLEWVNTQIAELL